MRRRVSKRTNATTALLQHILDKNCCSHVRVYLRQTTTATQAIPYEVSKEAHTLRFAVSPYTLKYISAQGITELLRWMKKEVEHANNSWTETDPSDMERDIELYSQDLQNMEVMIDGEPDDV